MDPADDAGYEFSGTATMFRRQRWTIVATTVVITLAAVLSVVLSSSVYAASVDVAVEPVRIGAEDAFSTNNLLQQELATQQLIATSGVVASRAAEAVGGDAGTLRGRVTAEQLGETRVLRIVARDGDPQRAASIASAFATAYLDSRREGVAARVESAAEDLRARITETRERIAELESELVAEGQTGPGSAARIAERESLLQQLGELSSQLVSLEASGSLAETGGEIIREATAPGSAESPKLVQRLVLGLLVGLALGIAIAWLREQSANA